MCAEGLSWRQAPLFNALMEFCCSFLLVLFRMWLYQTKVSICTAFFNAQNCVFPSHCTDVCQLMPRRNQFINVFFFWLCSPARAIASSSHEVSWSHTTTRHKVGHLWTSDQLIAETSTWQQTQQTNVLAPGGIRTHDRSTRAAVDLRLRPRGHWDRQIYICAYKPVGVGRVAQSV
jgi:hypothetical protein